MGRFLERRYNPAQDSSPGYDEPEATVVTLAMKPGDCHCGCGEAPASPKSSFRMGHDARLKGKLIRAHLTDTPVVLVVGGHEYAPTPAIKRADEYGWVGQLEAAERRRADANRKVIGTAMHSKRLVKVGRWQYDAIAVFRNAQDKELFDVTYVSRLGETKTVKGLKADALGEVSC